MRLSLARIRNAARRFQRLFENTPYTKVKPGLYIGNSRAAREYADRFEYRISVAEGLEYDSTTASFDLTPNDPGRDEFEDAVTATLESLQQSDAVLVHCHEGRERAPTVAAASVAIRDDKSLAEVLEGFRRHRKVVEPTADLRSVARSYITEKRGEGA